MWQMAIPFLTKIASKLVGKTLKGKVSDGVIETVQRALPQAVKDDPEIKADFEQWSEFQLEYYGRSKNLPVAAQVLRSIVRPVSGLALTGAVIVGAFMGLVDWNIPATMATAVVAFYFGERSALK